MIQTATIESVKVVEWALKHPHRRRAFGDGSDLDIALLFTRNCEEGQQFHTVIDAEMQPCALIFFTVFEEQKRLHINHLLATGHGFKALQQAWKHYYPDFVVTGIRSRSKKPVIHKLSDFTV
jgi:hypothetical protein